MNIGIAAPIEIASLQNHLPHLTPIELKLGLGGTAINILIDGFINQGHHVTVFTLDLNIKSKYIIEGPNLKVIIGHFRVNSKWKWFDFCRKEYLQIQQFILEEKSNIDIVNAHWSYEFAIGTILAKVPHIITFRDHAQSILKLTKHPYRLTRLLMDNWVRRKGANFSYNSFYLKELIGLKGITIPNPIRDSEIGEARVYPQGKDRFKICYIANGWDYRKNPEAALEAFYLLQKEKNNIELHMIGSGFEHNGSNFNTIQEKGWGNEVYFHGRMSHTQLMEALKQYDILLHTAREESFGNNLIEAIAKGIPVLAGKTAGAVPWVLADGLAGCLTDVENPTEIAKDLLHLISDSPYYEKLSENGITNLQTRFTQDIVCKNYTDNFEKIVLKNQS